MPRNQADLQIIREDRVNPCLERLDRLESVFNQLSRKPPELPQDKDQAIQDSFDRIKSIEFDLEKTKKVNLCFKDLMVLRLAFGFSLDGYSSILPFVAHLLLQTKSRTVRIELVYDSCFYKFIKNLPVCDVKIDMKG